MLAYYYPTYSSHWLLHGLSVLVSMILVMLTLVASLVSSLLLLLVSVLWTVSFHVTHSSTSPTVNLTCLWFPYLAVALTDVGLQCIAKCSPHDMINIFSEALCDLFPSVLQFYLLCCHGHLTLIEISFSNFVLPNADCTAA